LLGDCGTGKTQVAGIGPLCGARGSRKRLDGAFVISVGADAGGVVCGEEGVDYEEALFSHPGG